MRNTPAIGIVFALIGCRGDLPPQHSSAVAATSIVATASSSTEASVVTPSVSPDSLRDDLVEHGLRISDKGREAVRRQLGQPDSTRARSTQNRHNPAQTDSLVDLFYPGLQLHYYVVVAQDGRDNLQSADVWDNRYLKYPTMGIGASSTTIVAALGEPWTRTGDAYSYDCGRCIGAESPVYFHLEGGRVKFVEYTFYVD
jgi:hypothetical protein